MDPFVSQLAELCRRNPSGAKWVFVPSHALGHTMGERLALEGTNWANLRFTTPVDVALQMAAPQLVELGVNPCPGGIGSALIMRLLVELPSATAKYFRPLAEQPNMADALWSTIRELRMAELKARDFRLEAFDNADKHGEIQALLSAYEQYLATNKLADTAAVFEAALGDRTWCPITEADTVLELPGLLPTPLERRFLDSLPGTRVPVATFQVPGIDLPRRMQIYSGKLTRVSPELRRDAERLAFLMDPAAAPAPRNDGTLAIFRAAGREAEVEEVMRHISNQGLPLDQVEMACASAACAILAWEKAQSLSWPVTIDCGVPIAMTRPGRALFGFCDWIEGGFSASSLRRLLQSGDIELELPDGSTAGQAARILLQSEATWGRETFGRALTALAAEYRGEPDDDRDEEQRARDNVRADRADQVRSWIENLLKLVPNADASGTVLAAEMISAATSFIERHAAKRSDLDGAASSMIHDALLDLRILGNLRWRISECLTFIRNAIRDLAAGGSRSRPGHLHVSLLVRSGYAGRPNTFVIGLEEGNVFPSLIEDPVLLDRERGRLSSELPLAGDHASEAVYLTISRLAALGGRVCLSFSCRDLREMRETFPSWIVLQAFRLQRADPRLSYTDLEKSLQEPVTLVAPASDQALTDAGWWLTGLCRTGTSGLPAVLQAFPSLASGQVAEQTRQSSVFTPYDGFVPEAGLVLDPCTSGRPVSPTGLEQFAGCPFQYFMKYGLGLDPIEEEKRDLDRWLDPRTRGSALHEVYARLLREVRDSKAVVSTAAHLPRARAIAEDMLRELCAKIPPPSNETYEREYRAFMEDVELFVELEAKSRGRTPIGFEVEFGFGHCGDGAGDPDPLARPEPITITIGKGRVLPLRGRIDRIDRLADGTYGVIDYKTGSFFEPAYQGLFRGGRLLQHALYGIAAGDLLKATDRAARVTVGMYYFPTRKGCATPQEIPQPPRAEVIALLSDLSSSLRAGAFINTDDEEDCKFCEYHTACLHGRDSAAAKMNSVGNDGLAAFKKVRARD